MTEDQIERTLDLLLSINTKLDKLLQAQAPQKPQKPLWPQAIEPFADPRGTVWLCDGTPPVKSVGTVYYFQTSSTNPNAPALVKPPTETC